MKGWQFSCHNHCFRYYICWSQVSRKLPDNYAVKQLLQQLVEGVHQLACGHSTDKYYSVDRVPWQSHQLAYRQCTNTIQLIGYSDRVISWHIDNAQILFSWLGTLTGSSTGIWAVHKYYSVDRVYWQAHWLAYRQCTNIIQLIGYSDRVISWHIDSVQSYLSLNILPAPYSHLLSCAVIAACTTELSVLYSFSLTLDWVQLFWKMSQLQWWETRSQLAAWRKHLLHSMVFFDMTPYCLARYPQTPPP